MSFQNPLTNTHSHFSRSLQPPQQRLIFGGRNLVDDQTADQSGIKPGVTLHLILSLRG